MTFEVAQLIDAVDRAVAEAVFIAKEIGYPFVEAKPNGLAAAMPNGLLQVVQDTKRMGLGFDNAFLFGNSNSPWPASSLS